jgi:phosphohistidine phosphatase SixA
MRWFFRTLCALAIVLTVVGSNAKASTADRRELLAALKSGGHILLMRHAQTEPGVGDPPNFKLDDCATQRNLSAEGRAQAKRMGDALRDANVSFSKTFTSQWCRCRDTAELLSNSVEPLTALNSFFNDRKDEPRQTAAVRTKAKSLGRGESWLMVTHQVNITALTGVASAMGEGVVVRGRDWKTIGTLAL